MHEQKFFVWTNPVTFTKPQLLRASGEAELIDTLYHARREQGLSEEEADMLCLEDSLEELSYDPNWAYQGNN